MSLFEICFEQAWKAMKEQLEASGYGEHKSSSPKSVIKLAYQARMVKDEEIWLAALQARNNVAHSYSEPIALSYKHQAFIFIKMPILVKVRCRGKWHTRA